jgi:hypothetical protein
MTVNMPPKVVSGKFCGPLFGVTAGKGGHTFFSSLSIDKRVWWQQVTVAMEDRAGSTRRGKSEDRRHDPGAPVGKGSFAALRAFGAPPDQRL